MESTAEYRRGKTGVWEFMLITPEGNVMAKSEWGTPYTFAQAEWKALRLLTPTAMEIAEYERRRMAGNHI